MNDYFFTMLQIHYTLIIIFFSYTFESWVNVQCVSYFINKNYFMIIFIEEQQPLPWDTSHVCIFCVPAQPFSACVCISTHEYLNVFEY